MTCPISRFFACGHVCQSLPGKVVRHVVIGKNQGLLERFSGLLPLVESSFEDVVTEVDNARIYGGMHYHHSVKEGNRLGGRVADYMLKTQFRRNYDAIIHFVCAMEITTYELHGLRL